MKTMASTEAKTNFGALLDAAQREPVGIYKKGRRVAVLVASEDYDLLDQARKQHIASEIRELVREGLASGLSRKDGKKFLDRLATNYAVKGRKRKK